MLHSVYLNDCNPATIPRLTRKRAGKQRHEQTCSMHFDLQTCGKVAEGIDAVERVPDDTRQLREEAPKEEVAHRHHVTHGYVEWMGVHKRRNRKINADGECT